MHMGPFADSFEMHKISHIGLYITLWCCNTVIPFNSMDPRLKPQKGHSGIKEQGIFLAVLGAQQSVSVLPIREVEGLKEDLGAQGTRGEVFWLECKQDFWILETRFSICLTLQLSGGLGLVRA
jgi:hypothetical protein